MPKKKIPKGQGTLFSDDEQERYLSSREVILRGFSIPDPPQIIDVEAAKERYLLQFRHRRCGGTPVAWVHDARGQRTCLGCSKCSYRQPVRGNEPLGESVGNKAWERIK